MSEYCWLCEHAQRKPHPEIKNVLSSPKRSINDTAMVCDKHSKKIEIILTGETYLISHALKSNCFHWYPKPKHWTKIVKVQDVRTVLEAVKPDLAKIYVKLEPVVEFKELPKIDKGFF